VVLEGSTVEHTEVGSMAVEDSMVEDSILVLVEGSILVLDSMGRDHSSSLLASLQQCKERLVMIKLSS